MSYTFANAAGDTLVAFVGIYSPTGFSTAPVGESSISDSLSNTWVLIEETMYFDDLQGAIAMWYCIVCIGGANTVTVSNPDGYDFDLQVWEYPATLTALDVWGG